MSTITSFHLSQRTTTASPAPPLGEFGALQGSGEAFHALADTMPQMVWSTLPDGSHDYYNARWYEFTGAPVGSTDGEGWAGMFHEEDQPGAWKNWNRSLKTGEPYEVEYRLRHHSGKYRWMIGRALPIRDADGVIQRWIGTCTDIDDQKRLILRNELLSRELLHRIKNLFAVVSGLITMTARNHTGFGDVARDLRERIASLGRAHEFVRPRGEAEGENAQTSRLTGLLVNILEAYPAFSQNRIRIGECEIAINAEVATPLALIFHELATNATKYGSLLNDDGQVDIDIVGEGEHIRFSWVETGGPEPGDGSSPGFGSRLLDLAISQQLGGSYSRELPSAGLRFSFEVPRSRFSAG